MRLAFLGTPEAAIPSLRAVVAAGHDVALVVTRPDSRRSRGGRLSSSAVKRAALDLGLVVGHSLSGVESVGVERAVVVAYGAIIPEAMLARTPMLNVHFSLLPRWRGAAPVQRAILAGDVETGVTVMSLEATLDTGPVHVMERVAVGEKTLGQLTKELAHVGAAALVRVLDSRDLLDHPTAQVGEATYAKKVSIETYHLRPSMTSAEVLRTVRLERAFTELHDRRLKVLEAHLVDWSIEPADCVNLIHNEVVLATADGAVALDVVQPEGSRPMSARAWWSGARLLEPTRWG